MTLQDLTDKQLFRLYQRVLRKIHNDGSSGYQPWGWDLQTLRVVWPEMAKTYLDLRQEGARRYRLNPTKYTNKRS